MTFTTILLTLGHIKNATTRLDESGTTIANFQNVLPFIIPLHCYHIWGYYDTLLVLDSRYYNFYYRISTTWLVSQYDWTQIWTGL